MLFLWLCDMIVRVSTQYSRLAHYASSRGSVVERSTNVQKVMSSTPIWSLDFFWVPYRIEISLMITPLKGAFQYLILQTITELTVERLI